MAKRNKQRLTITLDQGVLSLVDQTIDGKKIRNRSHAIEVLVSKQLQPRLRQAVVLASGEGVKMRPFTYEIPKPLLPVKGRPLLEHTIELLREANIREVVLVVGHLAEKIQDHFGDGSKFGVSIQYVRESKPRGTAHSLRAAKRHVLADRPFLVLYGDVLVDIDLSDLLAAHERSSGVATIALKTSSVLNDYGVVSMNGSRITTFTEKPNRSTETSGLINAGVMLFDPVIFRSLQPSGGAQLEKDVLERLVTQKKVFGYPFDGQWFDVGTPEEYQRALRSFVPRS